MITALQKKPSNKLRRLAKDFHNYRYLLIMLLPALTYIIIFAYIPMTGIVLAFKRYTYTGGIYGSPWVGFDNFKFLIISNQLWPLTRNTLLYNFAFITLGIFSQVSFALLLNEIHIRSLKRTFQSLMLLPYFISWVVVASIMQAVFSYDYGLLNKLLEAIGMAKINIYANPNIWPFLLVFVYLWKQIGYGSVIYLAAVTSIDPGLYEAAEIDGAKLFQRIRYITIPSITPTIIIMFLLAVGQVFRGDFGLFYQLVGNNALILPKTDILDLFIYRALITTNDYGMSSAAGLYQSVMGFITILSVNFLIKKIDPDYTLF